MKKWISFLLMVLLLSGCAGGQPSNDTAGDGTETQPGQESTQTPETPDDPGTPDNSETTEEPEATDTLPGEFPMEFVFASGAGAWGTVLTLEADGSFTGNYHDSEMGGEGGPLCYICDFAGQFGDFRQVDEFTYAMTLESVENLTEQTEPWVEDDLRYIPADPYGVEAGTEFFLYLPGHPLEGLDEEFLSWWPDNWHREQEGLTELGCYGIYNVEGGYGFFTSDLS